jgi:hypothetical protein
MRTYIKTLSVIIAVGTLTFFAASCTQPAVPVTTSQPAPMAQPITLGPSDVTMQIDVIGDPKGGSMQKGQQSWISICISNNTGARLSFPTVVYHSCDAKRVGDFYSCRGIVSFETARFTLQFQGNSGDQPYVISLPPPDEPLELAPGQTRTFVRAFTAPYVPGKYKATVVLDNKRIADMIARFQNTAPHELSLEASVEEVYVR